MKHSGRVGQRHAAPTGALARLAIRFRLVLVLATALGSARGTFSEGAGSGAIWLPYVGSDNGVLSTYGTSVAVDAKGGVHAAYAIYIGSDQGLRPATYAYCPGGCEAKENWTFTRLGDVVHDVRIALNPDGLPRLMLFGPKEDPETDLRFQYQYAECAGGCSDESNWTITTVVTPIESVATREEDNNRYFAISPQGEVAFIYTDTINNSASEQRSALIHFEIVQW